MPLEVVLSVNNLAYEVSGGIITIMTAKEYEDLNGEPLRKKTDTEVVRLAYAKPTAVAKLLDPVKSRGGVVVADDVTGSLVILDTPAKIREMVAIASGADVESGIRVFPTESETFVLQYAEPRRDQAAGRIPAEHRHR